MARQGVGAAYRFRAYERDAGPCSRRLDMDEERARRVALRLLALSTRAEALAFAMYTGHAPPHLNVRRPPMLPESEGPARPGDSNPSRGPSQRPAASLVGSRHHPPAIQGMPAVAP